MKLDHTHKATGCLQSLAIYIFESPCTPALTRPLFADLFIKLNGGTSTLADYGDTTETPDY